MKRFYRYLPLLLPLAMIAAFVACASPGTPDGGPYDETPPRFVSASPRPGATNNLRKRISLEFDEIIKLEKASEKVIVSPPQLEAPEVKTSGRRVLVTLADSLKPNTTYTVDFGDAIVDNNEGNPLGNFTYTFSTGPDIDSMQVAGTVLQADNLEPVKGMLVGLHRNLADSAFHTLPFDRVTHTDSRGRFRLYGVAPGKYRIFALKDGDQNFRFNSPTEMVAFGDSLVVPSCLPDTRMDTVWRDSLHIDTIVKVAYTHFLPDNVLLRAFKEPYTRRYLAKTERDRLNHFSLYFTAPDDTLPVLRGLNFDERDAFVIEKTDRNDTIHYWIKDSLLCEQDTLMMQADYRYTDSLEQLVPRTDTLFLVNKIDRARRARLKEEADKEREKERKKKEKRGESVAPETQFLAMTLEGGGGLDLDKNLRLKFEEPLLRIDTAAIHLRIKADTLWNDVPWVLRADSVLPRQYEILAEWQPGGEYQLAIDSIGFTGLYGLHTDKLKQEFKVKALEEYGTLYLNIRGASPGSVVQLLDSSEKIVRQQLVSDKNTCDFYFLAPGTKYYLRLLDDRNGNGIWDTGSYDKGIQPEEVFYFPKVWEMKANFEFEENWDVRAMPADRQKPDEIKKQKPEEQKKIKERNKERAKKLGKS